MTYKDCEKLIQTLKESGALPVEYYDTEQNGYIHLNVYPVEIAERIIREFAGDSEKMVSVDWESECKKALDMCSKKDQTIVELRDELARKELIIHIIETMIGRKF